jgi:hypothetical protein
MEEEEGEGLEQLDEHEDEDEEHDTSSLREEGILYAASPLGEY